MHALEQRIRCAWCAGEPLAALYHDDEWGEPAADDRDYFERLCLEIFQTGLNWRLILSKRPTLRAAFAQFDPQAVAAFGESDVERALADPGIIRHRGKVLAVVENARRFQALQRAHGSFAAFVQSFPPERTPDLLAALRHAFVFVGPSVARSFVEGFGRLPPNHSPDCWKQDCLAGGGGA